MRDLLCIVLALTGYVCISAQGFTDISPTLELPEGYDGIGYPGGVSLVDFNQDGRDDLTYAGGIGLQSGDPSPIRFYLNTDTGFTELDLGIEAFGVDIKQINWVDIDNDFDLDFFFTTNSGSRLFENQGELQFSDISVLSGFDFFDGNSYCATWLDYDEDGLLDVVIPDRGNSLPEHLNLYRNLGNGQFEDVTEITGLSGTTSVPLSIGTLDYNNDGWEDIYVGEDVDQGNVLLQNNGDGTFTDVSAASNTDVAVDAMTVTIGDYDNDGWFDLFTSDIDSCRLLRNTGLGYFEDVTFEEGLAIEAFTWSGLFMDVDNDMDLDLHISTYNSNNRVFENVGGSSHFQDAGSQWGFQFDFDEDASAAIGDINNDGYPDFSQVEQFEQGQDNLLRASGSQ